MQFPNFKRIKRIKLDSSDVLPIAVAALAAGYFVNCLMIAGLARSYSRLANDGVTLVQQPDGNAFAARPRPRNYREPEVVRQTVKDWLILTYNCSGTLVGPDGKSLVADKGIGVDGGLVVPSAVFEASSLLTDDNNFRISFLKHFAAEKVPKGFFNKTGTPPFDSDAKLVFAIQDLSDTPQLIDPIKGIWRENVVSTITTYDTDHPAGKVETYNVYFLLQAVEPTDSELRADASIYQRIVYKFRQRGLQITNILPLELTNKSL